MTPTIEVPCRVDYRATGIGHSSEHTSRLDSLSATGCTIRSRALPATDTLELRIYLPDGEWSLQINRAKVTWGHWEGFTVEFLSLPAKDQQRIEAFLTQASVPESGASLWPEEESSDCEQAVWA